MKQSIEEIKNTYNRDLTNESAHQLRNQIEELKALAQRSNDILQDALGTTGNALEMQIP